jgi:hypothetical protein
MVRLQDIQSIILFLLRLLSLGFVHLIGLFVLTAVPLYIGGYYGDTGGDFYIAATGLSMGFGVLGLFTVRAARRDTTSDRLGTWLLGLIYFGMTGLLILLQIVSIIFS